ncbi:hypothetical protein WG66_011542 [Moniliophthora roreri]|nr:hypothetical protein WG66_011542 [Moniliophthora roreri]
MIANGEGGSPFYISSHSADVILSDIRPIKLKIDALRCINVFLDEFLFTILKASRSLTTSKLRAGLLSALPTNLGKEALLEAEVELRAYWDRTKRPKGSNALEDDSDSFNLQWAFELLRLKCEAYSTLNESDEDPAAESRLNERMAGTSGSQSPKSSLVAPAALYLTAILEHILSNVGRVAARDSSRTAATINDVFIALCEDDSIYSLFKSMNVYDQIEQQSQEPRPRRSKSITRNDKIPMARTSSGDRPASIQGSSPPTRVSSELSSPAPTSGTSGHRSSFEKTRSMKKLMGNGRNSSDRDSASINGHKKSDSVLSDQTKHTWTSFTQADDDSSLQEFDDLMRSDSTMKVSLTPDRLKTMEVYKQEKQERSQRGNDSRQRSSNPTSSQPSRIDTRRPSLVRNVDSIQEDEEESQIKSSSSAALSQRIRQISVTSPPKPSITNRTRSISAAGQSIPSLIGRKSSKTGIASPPLPAMQTSDKRAVGMPMGFGGDPFPSKTRKIQHNRESLDLDDVMAGSDGEEDEMVVAAPKASTPNKRPTAKPAGGVSSSTRELMDFLNEGPPEMPGRPYGRSGREFSEFMDNGPIDIGLNDSISSKGKGSGRLQRMMSKLSIGGSEKDKGRNGQVQDDYPRKMSTPISPIPKASVPNLSMLANRPIPPRPPQPQMISPPSSPVPPEDMSQSNTQSSRPSVARKTTTYDFDTSSLSSAPPTPIGTSKSIVAESGYPRAPNSRVPDSAKARNAEAAREPPRFSAPSTPDPVAETNALPKPTPPPSIQTARKATTDDTTPQSTKPAVGLSKDEVQELRRHISRATTSDECRLIMDIFLAKAGVPVEPAEYEVPYPSPSPTDTADNRPSSADVALEHSLVELFLGGGEATYEPPAPRKKKYSSKKVSPATQTFKSNGHVPLPETVVKA